MKILFALVLSLVVMSACKRDYNCTCTSDYSAEGADDTKSSYTIKNTSQKFAAEKCDKGDKPENGTNVVVDCELNP